MDSSVSSSTNWDLVEVLSFQWRGGGEPSFYLVQMPHQLSLTERQAIDLQESTQLGGISPSALLQTTEKCHVRNLLFQSIRPCLCWPAKVFCEVQKEALRYNHPDRRKTSLEKKLRVPGRIAAWPLPCTFPCFHIMARRK